MDTKTAFILIDSKTQKLIEDRLEEIKIARKRVTRSIAYTYKAKEYSLFRVNFLDSLETLNKKLIGVSDETK